MKAWFYENYEDPVNCLPYESAEGGYQYIYGGPYEPSEVLQDEFGGFVPDNLIEKLASDLSDISFEWSGNPDLYPPDDYLYESVLPLSPAYPSLEAALSTTRKVADKRMAEDLYAFVLRLLFAGTIATMEAYLSDFFIARIKSNDLLKQNFVSTNPDFKQQKFYLSEIHSQLAALDKTIANYLSQIVWHNLGRVSLMYKSALGISFPEDMAALYKAVETRHDIVHRNGKSPDGTPLEIKKEDVCKLIEEVRELAHHIETVSQPIVSPHFEDSPLDTPEF
jgi:hypothetical protein